MYEERQQLEWSASGFTTPHSTSTPHLVHGYSMLFAQAVRASQLAKEREGQASAIAVEDILFLLRKDKVHVRTKIIYRITGCLCEHDIYASKTEIT